MAGNGSDKPTFQKAQSAPGLGQAPARPVTDLLNGSVVSTSSTGSNGPKQTSLRVYAGNAIVSPGALYKAVLATPSMSSTEVWGGGGIHSFLFLLLLLR